MEPDRFPYSPIITRPPLKWPDNNRVALWVVPNIEHYEYTPPPNPKRNPWPRVPHPDIWGYAYRDYGNRVGVWRMFEVTDKYEIRCTVSLNEAVFEHFPEIMEACEQRKCDYLSHGLYNTRYVYGMSEEEERAFIADCVDTFKRLTGRAFAGWLGPALSNTLYTPDLLAEAGIKYYCDWFHDDQPFPMKVRKGRLITLPYTIELNDVIVDRQGHDAAYFAQMIKDQFDVLYEEGAESGRVMCIALHPYWIGQPHRLKYLDEALGYICAHDGVWKATGEEIADWYYAHYYPQQ